MSYIVRYSDANGQIHQKEFSTERDAVAAYDKLKRLQKQYRISNIEAHDGFCFYYGNGIWD